MMPEVMPKGKKLMNFIFLFKLYINSMIFTLYTVERLKAVFVL